MDNPAVVDLPTYRERLRAGDPPADCVLLKAYSADTIKSEGGRKYTWRISTGAIDRDRDILRVDGWELDRYRQNPVVLWAHSYRELPVGKTEMVVADNGVLRARMEFAPAAANPLADSVRQLVDFGALRAASVGFRPLESTWNDERGGMDFIRQELLEFSIVPVPANPEALLDGKGAAIQPAANHALGWCLQYVKAHQGDGEWVGRDELTETRRALQQKLTVLPAYAPEPFVLEFQAALLKRGRVLSAENEARVRSARDAGEAIRIGLEEVLGQLEQPGEPEPPKAASPGLAIRREDVVAIVRGAVEAAALNAVRRAQGRLD